MAANVLNFLLPSSDQSQIRGDTNTARWL